METMINARAYRGIAVLPHAAACAAATLEVRGAAARGLFASAAAIRTWDDATTGMKRTAFVPTHVNGSTAWSPPL